MYRGVLNGKGLYGWISLHQRNQAGCDFLEETVVVVFDVRLCLPQCHAAELSRGRVQRLDVIDESGLRLMRGRNWLFSAFLKSFSLAGFMVQVMRRESMFSSFCGKIGNEGFGSPR